MAVSSPMVKSIMSQVLPNNNQNDVTKWIALFLTVIIASISVALQIGTMTAITNENTKAIDRVEKKVDLQAAQSREDIAELRKLLGSIRDQQMMMSNVAKK